MSRRRHAVVPARGKRLERAEWYLNESLIHEAILEAAIETLKTTSRWQVFLYRRVRRQRDKAAVDYWQAVRHARDIAHRRLDL